jgi:hypothetical protein
MNVNATMRSTRDARVYLTMAGIFDLSEDGRKKLDEILDEPAIDREPGWVQRYTDWCSKVHDLFSYVIKDDESIWNEVIYRVVQMDKMRFPDYSLN